MVDQPGSKGGTMLYGSSEILFVVQDADVKYAYDILPFTVSKHTIHSITWTWNRKSVLPAMAMVQKNLAEGKRCPTSVAEETVSS